MDLWTHDRWRFPVPDRHRFPMDKYGLLRARVIADGIARPEELHEADPVGWEQIEAVHDGGLVRRIRHGELSRRELQGLGLPWSPALVERARRSLGGTHHAGYAFARGYCLFNDVGIALAVLRAEHGPLPSLVVDCDVHQGDGTADLFASDPRTFTLSLHGARNYPFTRVPSDLDVDLASGTGDDGYLQAVEEALDVALPRSAPELVFYLAGADPWEGDRIGRLALTKAGLRTRDELVLDRLTAAGTRVCVVLAGGYAEDVRDTVDINAATAAAVARRLAPSPS